MPEGLIFHQTPLETSALDLIEGDHSVPRLLALEEADLLEVFLSCRYENPGRDIDFGDQDSDSRLRLGRLEWRKRAEQQGDGKHGRPREMEAGTNWPSSGAYFTSA
jgi:hypothetical protein